MEKVVSIDPGVTGGIAVFEDKKLVSLHTIPAIKGKVDYNELSSIWSQIVDKNTTVIIEEVHSIYGASADSNHSFGKICGFLLGIIVCSKLPYIFVQPKQWQGKVWANQDKVYKNSKPNKKGVVKKTIDTKATSLLAAKRLFPTTSFIPTGGRAYTDHDGLVDAALIGKSYFL